MRLPVYDKQWTVPASSSSRVKVRRAALEPPSARGVLLRRFRRVEVLC